MKPGKLNLPTIWRGCDWGPVTLKWKDKNGDPIPLTQWIPIVQSLNFNLNPTVLPQNIEDNIGVTTLSLTREETAVLKLGVESWDWVWQHNRNPTDYRFPPFLAGSVEIKQPTSKFSNNGHLPLPPIPSPDA